MKICKFKVILIISVIFLAATSVSAMERHFPPPMRGQAMSMRPMRGNMLQRLMPFLKLDLSQTQQKKLIDIIKKYKEKRREYIKKLMATHDEMAKTLRADKLDETSAKNIFEKQSSLREDLFILDLKMKSEVKNVFTPKQLELLKNHAHRRSGRHFERPRGFMGPPER